MVSVAMAKSAKVGPRIRKWQGEYDRLLARLKRLRPDTEAFATTVDRLVTLAHRLGYDRMDALQATVPALVDPEVSRAVERVTRALEGLRERVGYVHVQFMPLFWCVGCKRTLGVYVGDTWRYFENPTPADVPEFVVQAILDRAQTMIDAVGELRRRMAGERRRKAAG